MSAHICPYPHEFEGYLKYPDHGLSPYWKLGNRLASIDQSELCFNAVRSDREWQITFSASKSGIAPRNQDPISSDCLYELDIHLDGPDRDKAHFNVSPRFAGDMRSPDGEPLLIGWRYSVDGLDVHTQGSNIHLDEYPRLLYWAVQEISRELGVDSNHGWFRNPAGGLITTFEVYLRLQRHLGKQFVRSDGIFLQAMHLLSDMDDAEFVYKGENESSHPKNHRFNLPPVAAAKLTKDRPYIGKQLKVYHPKCLRDEDAADDDPLAHPKVGALFKQSIHGKTIDWEDRHELREDLEEIIINMLRWSDHVPTVEPDPTTFVADDHFKLKESDRIVEQLDNPLPEIKAEQGLLIAWTLSDLNDSTADVLKTIITDGGSAHYQEIADETGYSTSTVYRALEDLSDFLKSDDGVHKVISEHVRQELDAVVDHFESVADRTVDRIRSLMDVEISASLDDSFEQWLQEYGAEIVGDIGDGGTIRFDTVLRNTKSDYVEGPYIEDVLREGKEAAQSAGIDLKQFKNMRWEAEQVNLGRNSGFVQSTLE